LSKGQEDNIKTTEQYYWGECSDFEENEAKLCAYVDLSNRVIEDAVNQSINREEILKTINMGAHFGRLQQQGKVKILAWIDKDSVFVTTKRPITQSSAPAPKPEPEPADSSDQPATITETPVESSAQTPAAEPQPSPAATTDNPVLQELAACKNYKEVRKVANMKGLVRGSELNSAKGFGNPEKCIIAVFTSDGLLSALLDTGGSSRTDVLSGKTVSNPEQYYKPNNYFLWYLLPQRVSEINVAANVAGVQKSNSSLSGKSVQNSPVKTAMDKPLQSAPVKNTTGKAVQNFSGENTMGYIRLPQKWTGKSLLVNSFVLIGVNDTELQDKYNVHPCDLNSPDCLYTFYNHKGHEFFDDDDTFCECPLSPDVEIKAGIYGSTEKSTIEPRKMTVDEFADYLRSQGSLGIIASVTRNNNGVITDIEEVDIQ
jgi:hypothetical protein